MLTAIERGRIAERMGASATRLSTYRSSTVVPSAALLARMEHLAQRRVP